MAQKAGVVFKEHDEVRLFLRSRNHVVEKWLDGAYHKSTVSRALTGLPVSEELALSLGVMLDEMRHDPWAWCEPPERIEDVEGLQDYASYKWWYDLLRPTVPFSRFERMPKHPLPADEAEFLQERLSEWRSRLKGACDQYKSDFALVEALRADETPEYQSWAKEDTGWRLGARRPGVPGETYRHRVGNPGLRGRSADDVARAHGLARVTMRLPLIEEARLAYVPEVVEVNGHVSRPIEPWNGQEFEGVEWAMWEDRRPDWQRGPNFEVEHKVVYYWDGERYQVRDIDDGEGMFSRVRTSLWGEWRAPTPRERDLFVTGIERQNETADELLSRRSEKIAEFWESLKAEWASSGVGGAVARRTYPDGVPESVAVERFEAMVEAQRMSADVRDEQARIAEARAAFRNRLRR